MVHAFSRTELLIGPEALARLAGSRVAVFGIGGVGSYVVEGLARSGVGHFVLVDDDCICLTNINRQIHATMSTVGRPKVDVMKERILDINPAAHVEAIRQFYLPENGAALLAGDYDYIVDAVDNVTAKIDLAVRARERNIPIIAAMGAGNKLDPARFEVADLFQTSVCPLAKVMRKELRQRGIQQLKVVYSMEKPLTPRQSGDGDCTTDSVCHEGSERTSAVRRQIPGSISFSPSVMGLIIAAEVVKDLIE